MPPVGQTFGKLTILGKVMDSSPRSPKWLALCECGNVTQVYASNVRAGRTTSCNNHGHGTWRGGFRKERVTYQTAHLRVKIHKGPARDWSCVDCGLDASEWSYNYGDAHQMWERLAGQKKDSPYSGDPQYYEPRCVSCHRRYDIENGY